jgi:hypothetical protein
MTDPEPLSQREPVQIAKNLNAQLGFGGHLTSKQVVTRLRSDKRLLALLAFLVVGVPILVGWLPVPVAASVSIGVVAGIVLTWLGYKAISDVIETTIRG